MVDITKTTPTEEPTKKREPVTGPACENCPHYLAGDEESGICRRYPPTPVVTHDAALYQTLEVGSPLEVKREKIPGWKVLTNMSTWFPAVRFDWICGEHPKK